MFIPLKMVLIGIDPYPYGKTSEKKNMWYSPGSPNFWLLDKAQEAI